MVKADASWNSAELAHALCDALVARGHLKDKPAFIRTDREAKITSIFETVGLDGAKMTSFDNPGPLEMLVRKGTNGEAWVQQVIDALNQMLPEDAAHAAKKMTMDETAKEELAAAKEKSAQRRDRLQAQEEEQVARGEKGRGKGDRAGGSGGGTGPPPPRERDREEGWGDTGGRRRREGTETMECYNCGTVGHASRECPEPQKEKGGGKGKGKRERMQCLNCKEYGHKSRDCPHPVDEDAVAARLKAKAEAEAAGKTYKPNSGGGAGND